MPCAASRRVVTSGAGVCLPQARKSLKPNGVSYSQCSEERRLKPTPLPAKPGFLCEKTLAHAPRRSTIENTSPWLRPSPRSPAHRSGKFRLFRPPQARRKLNTRGKCDSGTAFTSTRKSGALGLYSNQSRRWRQDTQHLRDRALFRSVCAHRARQTVAILVLPGPSRARRSQGPASLARSTAGNRRSAVSGSEPEGSEASSHISWRPRGTTTR